MRKYKQQFFHDLGVSYVYTDHKGYYWFPENYRTAPFFCIYAENSFISRDFYGYHKDYPHFTFEWCLNGKLNVIRDGKTFLLNAGDGIFLFAGEDSEYYPEQGEPCHKACCVFTGELVPSIFSALYLNETTIIRPKNPERLLEKLELIKKMLGEQIPDSESELCGQAYSFLNLLAESVAKPATELLTKAKRLLQLQISFKNNISGTAKKLNISPFRLRKLIQDDVQMSPKAYLKELKMNTAAELLRKNNMRIGEVARQVGYDDPLLFSRMFRKYYGVSPRAYRLQKKKEEGS